MSYSVRPHRRQHNSSAVPGILQARTLEWVAISFSNPWKWKVKVKSLSRVWLVATPWTAAHQAPRSMRFSRQECWSDLPLPSPTMNHYSAINRSKLLDFPDGTSGKEATCQCVRCKKRRLDLWVGKIPWRREGQPTPLFLPGKSCGKRGLAGYRLRGLKELNTIWATNTHPRRPPYPLSVQTEGWTRFSLRLPSNQQAL